MLRFLRFLITGDWHLHEWDIIYTGSGTETFSNGNESNVTIYHLQ